MSIVEAFSIWILGPSPTVYFRRLVMLCEKTVCKPLQSNSCAWLTVVSIFRFKHHISTPLCLSGNFHYRKRLFLKFEKPIIIQATHGIAIKPGYLCSWYGFVCVNNNNILFVFVCSWKNNGSVKNRFISSESRYTIVDSTLSRNRSAGKSNERHEVLNNSATVRRLLNELVGNTASLARSRIGRKFSSRAS